MYVKESWLVKAVIIYNYTMFRFKIDFSDSLQSLYYK